MTFTRDDARAVRTEIEAAIAAVLAAHGMTPKIGAIRYDALGFRMTVEGKVGATKAEAAHGEWDRLAPMFGLKRDDFGAVIQIAGRTVALVEIRPRSPRFPVVGEEVGSGKRFKFGYVSTLAALAAMRGETPPVRPSVAAMEATDGGRHPAIPPHVADAMGAAFVGANGGRMPKK